MEALNEMDHEKIKSSLLKEQCYWITFKMNVPSASHMGGVWERQIRTVRNVLSSLLQHNSEQLDDESLISLDNAYFYAENAWSLNFSFSWISPLDFVVVVYLDSSFLGT